MVQMANATPEPRMLLGLQNQKWDISGAVAELVDNSLGAGRGDATNVYITWDQRDKIMTILDDGQGMDAIVSLFKQGRTAGITPGDIGKYGMGGTVAIVWAAERVDIWTLKDGMVMSDTIRWKDWIEADSCDEWNVVNEWKRATRSNTPAALLTLKHGTLIKMHIRRGRQNFQAPRVQRDLGRLFSPGLRNGKRIHWQTTKRGDVIDDVRIADPYGIGDQDTQIKFNVVINGSKENERLPVKGVVAYNDALSVNDSQIRIGFGHRVIFSTKECFSSPNGDEKFTGVGVSGWLDLGDSFRDYLTMTKDGFNDDELHELLMGHIFEQIRSLLEKSDNQHLDLLFDDLSLHLQSAMNGIVSGDITIKVSTGTDIEGVVRTGENQGGEPSEQGVKGQEKALKQDEQSDKERGQPTQFSLMLVPESDAALQSALCKADIRAPNTIIVMINKEHPVVQEALRARPTNKIALYLLATTEMAHSIVYDNHEWAMAALFKHKPSQLKKLRDLNGTDRVRTMARVLMDAARYPLPTQDSIEA